MSTTKFEHVIGRDGLHRLRLTANNGEIIDNSHEGFSSKDEALQNLFRKLRAYRELGYLQAVVLETHVEVIEDAPAPDTVDERVTQDPLEPQTKEN